LGAEAAAIVRQLLTKRQTIQQAAAVLLVQVAPRELVVLQALVGLPAQAAPVVVQALVVHLVLVVLVAHLVRAVLTVTMTMTITVLVEQAAHLARVGLVAAREAVAPAVAAARVVETGSVASPKMP
jgi:hypothetical protein